MLAGLSSDEEDKKSKPSQHNPPPQISNPNPVIKRIIEPNPQPIKKQVTEMPLGKPTKKNGGDEYDDLINQMDQEEEKKEDFNIKPRIFYRI